MSGRDSTREQCSKECGVSAVREGLSDQDGTDRIHVVNIGSGEIKGDVTEM